MRCSASAWLINAAKRVSHNNGERLCTTRQFIHLLLVSLMAGPISHLQAEPNISSTTIANRARDVIYRWLPHYFILRVFLYKLFHGVPVTLAKRRRTIYDIVTGWVLICGVRGVCCICQ
eukprot:COSAG02_NODE_43_length_45989_cov_93.430181_11_plen_119_part_00